MSVAIVLLASGAASRMGTPKQLLPFGASTLIGHTTTAAIAANVGPVFVVLGANHEQIAPELQALPVSVVVNPDWEEGLASSIRHGVSAATALHPDLNAIILALGDQPLISAETYLKLSDGGAGGMDLAACHYGDTIGTPALFGKGYFPDLLSLRGDRGAKAILIDNRELVRLVECHVASVDVDTPEDYSQAVADFSAPHI